MKKVFELAALFIFSALLAACGGGGGASLPSTNSDSAPLAPVITPAEQSQARVVVEELKILVKDSSLLVSDRDDILTRIQEIESAIESVRQTAAELTEKLAKLRQEIADVRVVVVTPLPPNDLNCGDHEMAVGQNCVCDSGYERDQGNVCVLPSATVTCTDFRVLRDGVCTYDTPEFNRNYALGQMGALYAYEQGYHGAGVTVAMEDDANPLSTHEDLRDAVVNSLHADRPLNYDERVGSHGTAVAGLIVAARNGRGVHGVAPEAKMVSFASGGSTTTRLQYVVDNEFPIINQSTGSPRDIYRGQIRDARYGLGIVPSYRPFSLIGSTPFSEIVTIRAHNTYGRLEDADIVVVHSAGNDRWQGPNSTIFLRKCGSQDESVVCVPSTDGVPLTLLLHEFLSEFVDEEYGELQTLDISPFGYDIGSVYPQGNPLLEDNWLVVVALNMDDTLARFSNGCGDIKQWCIAAYGVGHPTTSNEGG